MRVGIGYDVHALIEGRPLILGGIEIPYERGLLGHSDADVLIHAIMDALFGALAMGDIGKYFPDTDERFRGISSLVLLEEVVGLIHEKGYQLGNLDCILVVQRPKLADYIPAMQEKLAAALKAKIDQISVKATTTEWLGFEGREEGISAQAIVILTESINFSADSISATSGFRFPTM
ncbi:MAG TPA: 2-C-methyl-D-erythritol 2,4-cyclodiphosphate synthase [Desulfitobacterium sp.]|nr:2-C-methyl-D-erythritol 2,4-cyclodiphosphate synthase [Desulfitobacterium sp.]HVJ47561.1 2-C-methyl-D-erythritol 2,4-cyclodiphosphate synthase [Desulfitobacterium sp.]